MDTKKLFVPAHQMAVICGVPKAWLRTEAMAGRVPSLRAGRRLLFSPEAVKRALMERVTKFEGKEVAVHA